MLNIESILHMKNRQQAMNEPNQSRVGQISQLEIPTAANSPLAKRLR
jgi:hypothetical protein